LRICIEINGNDECVTTSCWSILKGLFRNPPAINQQSGVCDLNCIKDCWEGDEARLEELVSVCDPRPNELFYHACGNPQGFHISIADNGLCGRFAQDSGPIVIEIQMLSSSDIRRVPSLPMKKD